jgi:hypothetical protein
MATAVLMIILIQCLPTVQADASPVRVNQLDYPRSVGANSLFVVTVQVSYSDKFGMIDVGIWDVGKGLVIQSLVSNVTLTGPGQASFTFSLRAPSYPGRWSLEEITRAWVQDAWFTDKAGFVSFSVVVLDTATLTLNGLQPGASVIIDGAKYTANATIFIKQLKLGIHTVEVPEVSQERLGSRFIFTKWSDGASSNSRTLILSGNLTISPTFVRQYLLTVNSDYKSTGSGWYDEGKPAQFVGPETYTSPVFFGLFTGSYQFSSWSGDSQSNSPISTVVMNGPKTVASHWTRTGIQLSLSGVADLFIFASLILVFRRGLTMKGKLNRKRRDLVKSLALLLISLTILTSNPVLVSGQLPTPANASIVSIGDADWYYWNQPASDTCIFWLGGGTEYSQGGFLINPLEYESFGTIRFLQDLTKFYCVVTLEKGANRFSDIPNRTIYQELIQGQFSIDRQVHQWIIAQGYKHTFIFGYSVGAMAAASIAVSNPQDWAGSDGLVLITALLPTNVISAAHSLNTNLLLLYGNAPEFQLTGIKFFENAPSEGWHGASYFHKEIHVRDDMGHEVWSPLKTNTYSPIALRIIVAFIETSKALQIGKIPTIGSEADQSQDNWIFDISSVTSPSKVFWDEPFFVNVLVTLHNSSTGTMVAYDSAKNHTLAAIDFSTPKLSKLANIRLNMPPINSSQTFSLMILQKHNDKWHVASKYYPVKVDATSRVTLRILTHVPNSHVLIDNTTYLTSPTGLLQIGISRSVHRIEVQAAIDRNDTHYSFTEWNDSDPSPLRSIQFDNDTSLEAIYQTQYHVNVVSPYGTTSGTGWYNAGSALEPSISPLALSNPTVLFDHWTNGSDAYGLGAPIQVHSPMIIRADWTDVSEPQIDRGSVVWTAFCISLFSILLILDEANSKPTTIISVTIKLGK